MTEPTKLHVFLEKNDSQKPHGIGASIILTSIIAVLTTIATLYFSFFELNQRQSNFESSQTNKSEVF